jgi:hypothetical protein
MPVADASFCLGLRYAHRRRGGRIGYVCIRYCPEAIFDITVGTPSFFGGKNFKERVLCLEE